MRYLSCCADSVPKERMRVYCDGGEVFMNNYTSLSGSNINTKKITSIEPDKGQKEILQNWYVYLKKREQPIPFSELCETSRITFKVKDAIIKGNND
jgi:hypothetical protein